MTGQPQPRPSEPVELPSWLTIERVYLADDAACVAALTGLILFQRRRQAPAEEDQDQAVAS